MRFQAKGLLLALIGLAGCADEDEGSPTEAAIAYLEGLYAPQGLTRGTDWSIVSVVPIEETKTDTELIAVVTVNGRGVEASGYFSFTRSSGRWTVRHDINKLLRDSVIDSQTAVNDMTGRCANRLHERYGGLLEIQSKLRVQREDQEIVIQEGEILATVRSKFYYHTLPNQPSGLFVDTYAYQDGEWRLQGAGMLFDGPPDQ